MGTNYYLSTKNKELVHKYFEYDYKLEDEPDFHYEIHLNKCSYGWLPLFQRHEAFSTFKDLIQFVKDHQDDLIIINEYDDVYSLDEYIERILDHSAREPEPLKWVYEVSEFDKKFSKNPKKTLHYVRCNPEEAELWVPFIHQEYVKSELAARRKFHLWDAYFSYDDEHYTEDPDYPVDWTDGEFS